MKKGGPGKDRDVSFPFLHPRPTFFGQATALKRMPACTLFPPRFFFFSQNLGFLSPFLKNQAGIEEERGRENVFVRERVGPHFFSPTSSNPSPPKITPSSSSHAKAQAHIQRTKKKTICRPFYVSLSLHQSTHTYGTHPPVLFSPPVNHGRARTMYRARSAIYMHVMSTPFCLSPSPPFPFFFPYCSFASRFSLFHDRGKSIQVTHGTEGGG